jgi:3-dehydroquinate synthase/shikimate kinase/3-dehydroquinate synthase
LIVLVGFMGAGKSTVGRILAARAGAPFIDTDALIEGRWGAPIERIFKEEGEPAFREIERGVVAEVLEGPEAVVALGGGAMNDPATATALEWHTVVWLDVSYGEAMRRIGADAGRPMLTIADPKALYDQRNGVYERVADHRVPVDDVDPEEVATAIASKIAGLRARPEPVRRITVSLGPRSYDVLVGRGISEQVTTLIPPTPFAEKAMIVTHASLAPMAKQVAASLETRGLTTGIMPVPEGEVSKSIVVAESLWEQMVDGGWHRNDLVVAFGGGVISDVAGFVAATYNRGVPFVAVPTTLLGQVDAAIGGKTAVNLPQGKNLVGVLHQPLAVVCDVDLLRSLPPEELRSGLAEVVKYGLIADATLLALIERQAELILAGDPEVLLDVVTRCVAVKASIVSSDENERGVRAHLNYGHTFGHAIEAASEFRNIRHGEAVALGMMAAAYLAHELGRIDEEAVQTHRRVLQAMELPVTADLDLAALERAWRHDKKYQGGVRFVLLSAIGRVDSGVEAPRPALEAAIKRLAS